MTIIELQHYLSAVKDQYISKEAVIKMLYNMAGGYDYIETELRGAVEKVSRASAITIDFKFAEEDDA